MQGLKEILLESMEPFEKISRTDFLLFNAWYHMISNDKRLFSSYPEIADLRNSFLHSRIKSERDEKEVYISKILFEENNIKLLEKSLTGKKVEYEKIIDKNEILEKITSAIENRINDNLTMDLAFLVSFLDDIKMKSSDDFIKSRKFIFIRKDWEPGALESVLSYYGIDENELLSSLSNWNIDPNDSEEVEKRMSLLLTAIKISEDNDLVSQVMIQEFLSND